MITVYSKTNCPGCESLKKELDAKNIPYNTVLIDKDVEGKIKVLEAGFRSVPQIFDEVSQSFISREQAGL
jgi:glutaredoxin